MLLSTSSRVKKHNRHLKPEPGRQTGFTLIELLVVIAIIAIMATVVTLNFNFRNPSRMMQDEARRLFFKMQIAADAAIYSRQQFGIRFHPESYEFYALVQEEGESSGSWQPVEDQQLSSVTPEIPVEFEVEIEGIPIVLESLEDELAAAEDSPDNAIKPHVMFLSNGELMPDYRIILADKEDGKFRHQVFVGEEEPIMIESLEP